MMNKVFMVMDIGDPYEPGFPLATCSSIDKVKELFPEGAWECIKLREGNEKGVYRNTVTGQEVKEDNMGCPPTPYIDEVELDVRDRTYE